LTQNVSKFFNADFKSLRKQRVPMKDSEKAIKPDKGIQIPAGTSSS